MQPAVLDVFAEKVEPKIQGFHRGFHVGYGSTEDGRSPDDGPLVLGRWPYADPEMVDGMLDTP